MEWIIKVAKQFFIGVWYTLTLRWDKMVEHAKRADKGGKGGRA